MARHDRSGGAADRVAARPASPRHKRSSAAVRHVHGARRSVRLHASARTRTLLWVATVVCACAAALVVWLTPAALNGDGSSHDAGAHPSSPAARALVADAHRYNVTLTEENGVIPGRSSNPPYGADLTGRSDSRYQNLLPGEQMGRIVIPKISVDMPISHGADDEALADGSAGHLYNSSLPVGGKGTRAIISGHRGAGEFSDFIRLGELVKGDLLCIKGGAAGDLWYRVESVRQVGANTDGTSLEPVPGRDLLTLETCTPMFVNSARLLVTGHRVNAPASVPSSQRDNTRSGALLAIVGLWLAVLACDRIGAPSMRAYHSGDPYRS